MPAIPDEKVVQIIHLYQSGTLVSEICRLVDVCVYTIYRYLNLRCIPLHGVIPDRTITNQKNPFVMFNSEKFSRLKTGYYRTTIKPYKWLHREVWKSYNGNIPPNHHIHHIDHDIKNNTIENLACIENTKHSSHHHAGKRGQRGTDSPSSKLTATQTEDIRANCLPHRKHFLKFAAKYNVHHETIRRVVLSKTYF